MPRVRARAHVPPFRLLTTMNRYHYLSGLFFIYRSGASATGCRHQVVLGERYLDLRQNSVLGEARLLP